jgi:RNA polymerase sigma factor (sigma-70 family)
MANPQPLPDEPDFTIGRNRAIEARAKELMRAIVNEKGSVETGPEGCYWDELFLLVRQPLLNLLQHVFVVVNADDQDDLFQDVMLRLYRFRYSYDLSNPFLPWLYAIARNVKRGWLTTSKHKEELSALKEPAIGENLLRKLTVDAVLAKLPQDDRLILWLFYREGLTTSEISNLMDIPLSTAKFYLRRAKKHAREIMDADPSRGETNEA